MFQFPLKNHMEIGSKSEICGNKKRVSFLNKIWLDLLVCFKFFNYASQDQHMCMTHLTEMDLN